MTAWPDWVTVAFHALVIFWSPGKLNVNRQPVIAAVPVLSIVTFATNPPAHSLALVYTTWQVPPPPPEPVIVHVNVAVPVAPVPSFTDTATL